MKAYVACARAIVKYRLIFDRIKVAGKTSRTSWTRDGWLTKSKWSSTDFVFHGWKQSPRNKWSYVRWQSPFLSGANFTLERCSLHQLYPFENWKYNLRFVKPEKEILKLIEAEAAGVKQKYVDVGVRWLKSHRENGTIRG